MEAENARPRCSLHNCRDVGNAKIYWCSEGCQKGYHAICLDLNRLQERTLDQLNNNFKYTCNHCSGLTIQDVMCRINIVNNECVAIGKFIGETVIQDHRMDTALSSLASLSSSVDALSARVTSFEDYTKTTQSSFKSAIEDGTFSNNTLSACMLDRFSAMDANLIRLEKRINTIASDTTTSTNDLRNLLNNRLEAISRECSLTVKSLEPLIQELLNHLCQSIVSCLTSEMKSVIENSLQKVQDELRYLDSKVSALCERPAQLHRDEIANISNLHDELLHNTLNDVMEVPSDAVNDSWTWNTVENLAVLVGDSAVPFEFLYPSGQHDNELRLGTSDVASPLVVSTVPNEATTSNTSASSTPVESIVATAATGARRMKRRKKSTKQRQCCGCGRNGDQSANIEARQAENTRPVSVANRSTTTEVRGPSASGRVTAERVNHRPRQQSSRQSPANRPANNGAANRSRTNGTHCTSATETLVSDRPTLYSARSPSLNLPVTSRPPGYRGIRSGRPVVISESANTGTRQISTQRTSGSSQSQPLRQQGFPNSSTTLQQPINNSHQYPNSRPNYQVRWQFEESLVNRILQALRLQH